MSGNSSNEPFIASMVGPAMRSTDYAQPGGDDRACVTTRSCKRKIHGL